jgi:hypothetical protein
VLYHKLNRLHLPQKTYHVGICVKNLHGMHSVSVGFWMDDVCAPSVGHDRHTIVLAVDHFLGYVGLFCRYSMHTQHTFETSETISCATQAQKELQYAISVFRKHGVDGAERKYIDTNRHFPGTGTSILDRYKAAQRSIHTNTATR